MCLGPIVVAAFSPFLAFRQPVYILSGFAGILALAFMLVQPLLAAGLLPGLGAARSRRLHMWSGAALLACVSGQVGGRWFTSPPDVVVALLFV